MTVAELTSTERRLAKVERLTKKLDKDTASALQKQARRVAFLEVMVMLMFLCIIYPIMEQDR